MVPKGNSHGHQNPQPSDYETDAPPVDVPAPPPRSNEELNLSVLRRHYPGVVAIRHVTSYAVLYAFNLETESWEKVGIEGTLFLCELIPSLEGADRFSIIILNRRGLNNFDWEISSDEDMEMTEEYIIVKGDQVYGIWVFSEPPPSSTHNARAETTVKVQALAKQASESRRAARNGIEHTTGQTDQSVPMGRQLSLRELFGRQREQDDGWSVHNHHSATSNQEQWVPPNPPQPSNPPQNDVLSQLFMKAKQDYNGFG